MQVLVQPTPVSSESIQDIVAGLLQAGTNVMLTYNDVANTLTIAASGGTSYTDEQAQDAIGTILVDTPTIDFTYNDATPAITADVKDASIIEAKLNFSDNTTQNVSTTRHGLVPKAPDNAAQYLDGTGTWSTPAGGSTNYWSRTEAPPDLTMLLQAYWRMEEASGNRVDSVSGQVLVPIGSPTSVAGKTGNAVGFSTTTGVYLSATDSVAMSAGAANASFTVCAWVYFNNTPTGSRGIIGKGNASIAYANCEYLLATSGTAFIWYVGNNSSSQNIIASGVDIVASTWYFVVGWYDGVADIMYIQVNNGTPSQLGNSVGSFDGSGPVEVGRQPQWTGSAAFDGRIDNVGFWKRVLTSTERSALYNNGNGLDYPFAAGIAALKTATAGDQVLLSSGTASTTERLEVDSGIKLANSSGSVEGIIRWTGTDIEVRKGGVWTSLTTTSFLLLIDTPNVYVGNALKLLRVNAAENALEYGPVLGTMATQNANAVAISGGQISIGGHAATGVLDVQTGVQASDIANVYFGLRIWPVAPSGAVTINGIRIEAATGAAVSTVGNYGIVIQDQPVTTGPHVGVEIRTNAGAGRSALTISGTAPSYFGGNVEIVGATTARYIVINDRAGDNAIGIQTGLNAAGGTGRYAAYFGGTAPSYFGGTVQIIGTVGIGAGPTGSAKIETHFDRNNANGIILRGLNSDTLQYHMLFQNAAGTNVGTIYCTATATAYNTSSDVRLKHNIKPLTNVLDCIRALRPISHLWNADGSYGEGFLAHELQQQVPLSITGEPDAVNEDGSIRPQQVDHSKLVPRLTAGLQDALKLIESLTARVTQLEARLA